MDPSDWQEREAELRGEGLFMMTGKEKEKVMRALLLTAPNVLTDNWQGLEEKIIFLFQVKRK